MSYVRLACLVLTLLGFRFARPADPAAPPDKLNGIYVEFCSCERLCDSALAESGRRSTCAFAVGLRIDAGQRDGTLLGGLTAALVAPRPDSADARPGGGPTLYVDPRASPAQAEALRAFLIERFGARIGGTVGKSIPRAIAIQRTTEALGLSVEGVAALSARPLLGPFGRPVQLENAPGPTFPFPSLGRGTAGQVADAISGTRFDAKDRCVLHGKFDFGGPRSRKKGP